jgi:hypothetical protein
MEAPSVNNPNDSLWGVFALGPHSVEALRQLDWTMLFVNERADAGSYLQEHLIRSFINDPGARFADPVTVPGCLTANQDLPGSFLCRRREAIHHLHQNVAVADKKRNHDCGFRPVRRNVGFRRLLKNIPHGELLRTNEGIRHSYSANTPRKWVERIVPAGENSRSEFSQDALVIRFT